MYQLFVSEQSMSYACLWVKMRRERKMRAAQSSSPMPLCLCLRSGAWHKMYCCSALIVMFKTLQMYILVQTIPCNKLNIVLSTSQITRVTPSRLVILLSPVTWNVKVIRLTADFVSYSDQGKWNCLAMQFQMGYVRRAWSNRLWDGLALEAGQTRIVQNQGEKKNHTEKCQWN